MVQINFAQKEIQCKIVYYGPGMSGKTTNLEVVHGKVPSDSRGELTSIATTGERTLYFDYMPLDLGQIAGICTKFQLYTVPGQIYYKSTRRLVLQGVDGIVFVADSSKAKMRENLESFEDLEQNLKEMGKSLTDVPIIIQYNKRDLPDAMTIEELEKEVNPHGFPYTEAIATKGDGIFPTLKELSELVLEAVNKSGFAATRPKRAPRPAKAEAATSKVGEPVAAGAGASVVSRPVGGSSDAAVQRNPLPPAGRRPEPSPVPSPAHPPAPAHVDQSSGGHQPSVSHAGAMPKPATPTPPSSYAQRSMQDRVVQVSGLGGGGGSRLLVLGGLGLLIAAAAYFVVTKVL